MASKRQIEANRRNAQKCTGPRSEKGRAISSQNALKTGLDAKAEVLRFESRPEYEALIATFYARYQPTVPEERALVDMLIRSEWLLRRYTAVDTAVWEQHFYERNETSLGAAFLKNQETLERAGRRINWAQRNYQIALKQLLHFRAERDEKREPAPAGETQTTETKPQDDKLVSFLQNAQIQPQGPKAHGEGDDGSHGRDESGRE